MRRMIVVALAMLALGAQAEEESTPCDNAETDQQNYDCAVYNKKTADQGLADSYKDLISRVEDQYKGHQELINEMTAKIKAAQQLWTKLRDADCAVETVGIAKGKELDIAQNTCLAQRSDDRSEYLQTIAASE